MNDNSLFDMLGIIIGFSGIMLTLSMVVTALMQAFSSYWKLRWKNLKTGLGELLETAGRETEAIREASLRETLEGLEVERASAIVVRDESYAAGAKSDVLRLDQQKVLEIEKSIAKVEHDIVVSPLSRLDYPKLAVELLQGNKLLHPTQTRWGWLTNWLAPEPETTWITKEELERMLQQYNVLDQQFIDRCMEWFARMEMGLSQRFLGQMRFWTFVCSLLVAFAMQVSTPELLSKLSRDPAFRDSAVALAEIKDREEPELQKTLASYRDIAPDALDKLAQLFPDSATCIEEASGEGATVEQQVAELKLVCGDTPEFAPVVESYRESLNAAYKEANAAAINVYHQSMKELSLIEISFWSRGNAYYVRWENVVGVLITAILISFGAPFWFKVLQSTINLRDALKRPTENEKENTTAT